MYTPLGFAGTVLGSRSEPSCRNSIRPCQFAVNLCSEPSFFFLSVYPSQFEQPGCCCCSTPVSSPCGIHGEAITGIRCRVETGLLYQPRISPHFPSAPSVCFQMAHSHQADGPTSASNLFISPQTERGLWEESLPTLDSCPFGPLAGEHKRQRSRRCC